MCYKYKKIRSSAAEMHSLFTHFALIIGHKVDPQSVEWKLYLKLRKIMAIVFSKTIHRRSFELLAFLVKEHHELYIICFGRNSLKPKHHFMVHYPKMCFMIGSLQSISSMRYESFHKKFKNVANTTTCRINLLTTFAIKCEYQFANFLLNFDKLLYEPNFGKSEDISNISKI